MSPVESPYWLQFVQPFAAVAVGAGAFFIAFRQWRIAHDKLRLDLFSHRMVVFEETIAVLHRILKHETVGSEFNDYLKASYRAQMLFGKDVEVIIDDMRQAVSKFDFARKTLRECDLSTLDRNEWIEKQDQAYLYIGMNHDKFRDAVAQYTRFETRKVSFKTLSEYFHSKRTS